ncbi:mechanosensitive ion channel family protein [Candidatus Peribacteria bacterium]|nr:mechanosensitive ion channel family protein [Candidatus Peribacteria bacterium]
MISFPNKTIFEKNIKNWSHGSDFLLMSLDFLLDYGSDIERAKEVLMEVV